MQIAQSMKQTYEHSFYTHRFYVFFPFCMRMHYGSPYIILEGREQLCMRYLGGCAGANQSMVDEGVPSLKLPFCLATDSPRSVACCKIIPTEDLSEQQCISARSSQQGIKSSRRYSTHISNTSCFGGARSKKSSRRPSPWAHAEPAIP